MHPLIPHFRGLVLDPPLVLLLAVILLDPILINSPLASTSIFDPWPAITYVRTLLYKLREPNNFITAKKLIIDRRANLIDEKLLISQTCLTHI